MGGGREVPDAAWQDGCDAMSWKQKRQGRITMKSYLAVFAAALLLATPSTALAQAGSKGTVKVGVLLPLTGNTAWAGKTNRIAATIAAEEVNAQDLAGGYKIDLVFGDSQCEPRAAHDQAERLISQDKAQLLIGEWCSSASVAVAQVANDEKIPLLVNISTADQIAGEAGPYAFQSSMQNRYSQQREAALLEKNFKFESVAIIVENNDFGLSFRKNMTALMAKAGKKVVLDVTQDRNDANWYATITRIPAAKPDLVIVSISAVQAANFVKQYAEAGITTPLFSDYPPPPRIFERQVGLQAGKIGLVRAAFFVKSDTNTPAQKEFVAKLEARAQTELNEAHDVTYWDVASYDAVRLVADAIKRGGPQPAGYLKAMAATGIDLVLGHYAFDEQRGAKPDGLNFVFIRTKPDGSIEVVQ
jgi:branched-chain amino acid transport system substrate-binding protein